MSKDYQDIQIGLTDKATLSKLGKNTFLERQLEAR